MAFDNTQQPRWVSLYESAHCVAPTAHVVFAPNVATTKLSSGNKKSNIVNVVVPY
eukprot:m.39820 g.39820  ORF g.39820 m.39820 type:complete len:55 (-) comp18294_c0_seq1:154-318(-)